MKVCGVFDPFSSEYVKEMKQVCDYYINDFSELIDIVRHSKGAIFNNAAQVWNHTFYFEQFGSYTPINGQLAKQIVRQWGTIEKFKEEFVAAGVSQFGSGWVWLACDKDGELSILTESNAGNPLTKGYIPLLTFDVWEHAYYIDYRNLRADYLNALWKILDWRIIEDRYMFFFDY